MSKSKKKQTTKEISETAVSDIEESTSEVVDKTDTEKDSKKKKHTEKSDKHKKVKKHNTDDNEINNSDKSEESDNITVDDAQLKEKVVTFLKLDDIITIKRNELKELMTKKIKEEDFIKEYLEKANKTKIETSDGDIVFKKQTSKSPFKEELVEKAIVSKFKDVKKITGNGVEIAHEILEEVNQMRGVSVKSQIRRVKKNKSKNS